jgi:two-component system cell cycle response regulator DivK
MQDAEHGKKNDSAATILVIEDDALNTALFKEILTARGYRLLIAPSGLKALEMLGQTRPDLIIMDIVLPEISGLDLIRMIKGDEERRSIPIVAVTSLPAKLYKAEIMAAGCDAYVAKPLSVTTLWATIDHLLTESRAEEVGDDNPLMRMMGPTG